MNEVVIILKLELLQYFTVCQMCLFCPKIQVDGKYLENSQFGFFVPKLTIFLGKNWAFDTQCTALLYRELLLLFTILQCCVKASSMSL